MNPSSDALVEQFQEGRYLSHIDEVDAANVILLGCVQAQPDDVDFVDGFLVNLARRRPQASSTSAHELPLSIAAAVGASDWKRVRREGAAQLVDDPWNIALLQALATAAGAQNAHDVELRYLRAAAEVAPNDIELLRRIGQAHARLRQYDEALEAWLKIESLVPDDADAARTIAMLVTARSRQRHGLPSDRTELLGEDGHRMSRTTRPAKPRSLLRIDEGRRPRELPPSSADGKRTPIQQLEAAVREFPSDVVLYLQLAPMYLEKGRDYDAEKLLAKALTETDNEPRVRELFEDVTMQRLGKKIQQAQLRVEVDNTEESRADLADLCAKRDRLEIDIFTNRAKANPDDTQLALELGRRLRQAGRTRDALPHFERALKDELLESAAAYELAECSLSLRDVPAATRNLRRAIDAATRPADAAVRKKALWRAAEIASQMRLPALARGYLKPLLQLEPEHREASALLSQDPT